MSKLQKILMGVGIVGIWILSLVVAVQFRDEMCSPVILSDTTTVVVHDTDTVFIAEPLLKDERFLRNEIRRLKVELASRPSIEHDTVDAAYLTASYDSMDVELPFTQRHYVDSTYEAWVSGYEPQLDSITIYRHNTIVMQYVPVKVRETIRPKVTLSIGPYAGYGPTGFDYGIGLTVGYPLICF